MGKASPSLKSLRVPVRFFQSAFCLVFEEPVHGREHDSRPFGADMRVEIDFVVEKIDFSMPNHAEELPGHIEIVGMNDSIPYCESRAGFAGNAVTGARHNMIQDFRDRPENRDGKHVSVGDRHFSRAAHSAWVEAHSFEIIGSAELATHGAVMIVAEIEAGETGKIQIAYSQRSPITGIVSRERNLRVASQGSGEDVSANVQKLQLIDGKRQARGDAIEGQRLSQKNVLHSTGAIHIDFQAGVFAAAKLIQPIGGDGRRPSKFIGRDGLPKLRVNPKDGLGRVQRTFNVGNAHLAFFEIVRKTARPRAFVAGDPKIVASQRPVGEMDLRVRAVHPHAAKPTAPQGDCPRSLPVYWVAVHAAHGEADYGRARPLPFPQKLVELRGRQRSQRVWRDCAFEIEAKVTRRVKQIGPDLPGLMMHSQVSNKGPLAVPGKISGQIGKWHGFKGKSAKRRVSDDVWPKLLAIEFNRTG